MESANNCWWNDRDPLSAPSGVKQMWDGVCYMLDSWGEMYDAYEVKEKLEDS